MTTAPNQSQPPSARTRCTCRQIHGIVPVNKKGIISIIFDSWCTFSLFLFSNQWTLSIESKLLKEPLTQLAILVTPALYFVYNSSIGCPQWMQTYRFCVPPILQVLFGQKSIKHSLKFEKFLHFLLCLHLFFSSNAFRNVDMDCQMRFVKSMSTLFTLLSTLCCVLFVGCCLITTV